MHTYILGAKIVTRTLDGIDDGYLTSKASFCFPCYLALHSTFYETYDDSPFICLGLWVLSIRWGVSWDLWAWSLRLLHLGPLNNGGDKVRRTISRECGLAS